MPYLTLGEDDPLPEPLPRREAADAPHPLAPTAETDPDHLWNVDEWDRLKWARDPQTGLLDLTFDRRPAVTR
jgi:hypothetical protein